MGWCYERYVHEFFGGNKLIWILEDLFKGDLLKLGEKCFFSSLRRFLLALSGPACIVCPLQYFVKDNTGDKWG
jgi:hypothetical protein